MSQFMKSLIKIIFLITASLCLTAFSCSKQKAIGNPYIMFEVRGTVYGIYYVENTDTPEEGDLMKVTSPIEGIKVTTDISSEPALTTSKGNFVVYGRGPVSDHTTIKFEDPDGDGNHGHFLTTKKSVLLHQTKPGDDKNYEGYWVATGVEVTLLQKDDELDPNPGLDVM